TWLDADGSLLRLFKRNTVRIANCSSGSCTIEIMHHPEGASAQITDVTLGRVTYTAAGVAGRYTININFGPSGDPFAVWQQTVEVDLRFGEDFQSLQGTATYHAGTGYAKIPQARSFLANVLSPTT